MKVTISERAEQSLDNIARYLETEWSVRVRDKFLEVLKRKIFKKENGTKMCSK